MTTDYQEPSMSMHNALLLITSALILHAPIAESQQSGGLSATRVTLMAGPALTHGGRTEVVRHATRAPRNAVIVDRNATPEDLAAALALLNAMRVQQGDSISADYRARPQSFHTGPTWQNSAYRLWLVEQLVRLRRSADVRMAYFGTAKAVEITLPSPRGTVSGNVGR